MTQFTLSLPLLALIAIFVGAALKHNTPLSAEGPSLAMRAEMKRISNQHKAKGLPYYGVGTIGSRMQLKPQ